MTTIVLVLAGIGAFVLYGVIGGLIARLTSARIDDDWAVVCCVAWPVLFLLMIPGLFFVLYQIGKWVFMYGRDREETASEP